MENIVDVSSAYEGIKRFITKTPLLSDDFIDKSLACKVFFKCENFQKIHAFKARGAINAVRKLPDKTLKLGIATHSSGNHGQAVALAARLFNTQSYIVMPENSPKTKIESVRWLGGKITFCAPTLEARESTLERIVSETGAHFIHPYNHPDVIEGQGTCAYEIFQHGIEPDYLLVPVGGGGLLSGTLLAALRYAPATKVIGCEPANADDALRSLRAGRLIPVDKPNTIADGLRTSLGELTFSIISKHVTDIFTVTESEILEAWRWITFHLKVIVEPSCAVPVAVLLKHKETFKHKCVAIILTGGNVDPDMLKLIL
ncbi:threonine ammonia-lyase [Schleiferia thermophila]|uniref:threonine ammonia-lyase n=1 Tax=Schleiferia thermophila TaxID=884107 RepID=UPI000564F4AA|nr:threonine/serine dehydratase [Schleiferia thermophila]